MSGTELNLVVLRSANLDRAARFYRLLGLTFAPECHDGGREHLACRLGSVVLEIYPAGGKAQTTAVRLGFQVPSVAAVVGAVSQAGGEVQEGPHDSPWGIRAVLVDPDGHRVEITEAPHSRA